MEKKRKKIFIIGNGHSGTTILYKMMAFHPDLAWFCQFSQRKGGAIPGRFYFPLADAVKRTLSKRFKHDWRKGKDGLFIPRPGEMNSLWKYLWTIRDLEERKERLRDILERELDSWGKDTLLIKNPWIGRHAALIDEALDGDCRFIHIVRDGRAVVHSILPKHERYHRGKEALESAVNYWVDFLDQIIAFGEKAEWKNITEVRYEDLVEDIPGTLRDIMRSCGLAEEKFPYDRVPPRLRSTNPRWINPQNRENIALIEKRAGKLLRRYRYL